MISGPFPLRLAKGNGCSLIHFPQWYSWQTLGIQENEVLAFWNQRYWSDLELCFLLFLFHLSNELFAAIGLGLYTGFLLWLLQRGMKNLHLLLTTCLLFFVDLNMLSVLFCLFVYSVFILQMMPAALHESISLTFLTLGPVWCPSWQETAVLTCLHLLLFLGRGSRGSVPPVAFLCSPVIFTSITTGHVFRRKKRAMGAGPGWLHGSRQLW